MCIGSSRTTLQPRPHCPPPAPPTIVYVHITKPLPPYALRHHFESCGPVESVILHPQNLRYAMIRFTHAKHAANAIRLLANTQVCGMALTVERHDSSTGEIRSLFAHSHVR